MHSDDDHDQMNYPTPDGPTQRQAEFLERHNLAPTHPIDFYDAMSRINRFINARRKLPPTPRQIQLLKAHGLWRDGMSRGEAFELIKCKVFR